MLKNEVPLPPKPALKEAVDTILGEWKRFEEDRTLWEYERAELKTRCETQCISRVPGCCAHCSVCCRVGRLEDECRNYEKVKVELMQRVKMLEVCVFTFGGSLTSFSSCPALLLLC